MKALLTVQMVDCFNHGCTVLVIANQDGQWKQVASVDSWAAPYLAEKQTNEMRDLVVFDHVTDDCMACSPPQPVRWVWDPNAPVDKDDAASGKGSYVSEAVVPRADQHLFSQRAFRPGQK